MEFLQALGATCPSFRGDRPVIVTVPRVPGLDHSGRRPFLQYIEEPLGTCHSVAGELPPVRQLQRRPLHPLVPVPGRTGRSARGDASLRHDKVGFGGSQARCTDTSHRRRWSWLRRHAVGGLGVESALSGTTDISLALSFRCILIAIVLQVQASTLKQLIRVTKPALAGALTVLLLLVQAAAVSPDVHHWFHDDAGGANHDCAAVLLQKGLAEGAPSVSVAPAPPSSGNASFAPATAAPSAPRRVRPTERAPPLA